MSYLSNNVCDTVCVFPYGCNCMDCMDVIVWMCVWMVGGGCMDVSVAVKG